MSLVRRVVTVVREAAPGWWIVEDSTKRQYRVAGSEKYRKESSVVVLADQIISTAGKQETAEVFKV